MLLNAGYVCQFTSKVVSLAPTNGSSSSSSSPSGVPGERPAARPDWAPDALPPAAVSLSHVKDWEWGGEDFIALCLAVSSPHPHPPPPKKTDSPVSFSPERIGGTLHHLFSLQLPSGDPSLWEPDCHSANVVFCVFYEVIYKFLSRVMKSDEERTLIRSGRHKWRR